MSSSASTCEGMSIKEKSKIWLKTTKRIFGDTEGKIGEYIVLYEDW
jgi:hypothetical protein